MVSRWEVIYFKTDRGEMPVKEFVDRLSLDTKRKYYRKIEYLAAFGPRLLRPHAAFLRDGIYELRLEGRDGAVRVLYFFFDGNHAILAHAIKKETQAVPQKEIEIALARKGLFMANPNRHGLAA